MSTEKVLFYSRMEHPKIVVQTKKRFKDDGEATSGKVIQFDRHHYQTNDDETIEFLRNHQLFGSEYVEVKQRQEEPSPVGKPTVAKSAENEQFVEMENRIMSQVNSKLDAAIDKISSIIETQGKAPESEVKHDDEEDIKEEKKDKKKGK